MINTTLLRAVVCLGAVGAACLVTLGLEPLRENSPFLLFVAAIAFCAWWCGARCGLASIGASFIVFWYFVLTPSRSFQISRAVEVQLISFAFTSGIVWFAVSARHNTDDERDRNRRWLEKILRRAGDGIIAADPTGKVLFINPAAAALTGWSAEESAGRFLWEIFRVLDAASGAPADPNAASILRQGLADTRSGRCVLSRRDGSELPIVETSAPIILKDGTLDGVVVVFRRQAPESATAAA